MDRTRLVPALARGVGAAMVGGVLGAVLTRGLMRLIVLGAGALAIPVQATGIATTDLEAVGPLSAGQWTLLVPLFVVMAAVYVLQALIVLRLARSGRRDRQREPAATLVGAGGRDALGGR